MLYADLIRFNMAPSKGRVSLDELQSNWVVDDVSLDKLTLDEEPAYVSLTLSPTSVE